MGDPMSTSRGRSSNRGIKAHTTSMCKNEDGCSNEKLVKNSAELYKSSSPKLSTTTTKYVEKCHLPKKRFSYIYSQSEKLASSSKSSSSVNYKSSTEYDLVKSVENGTDLNELDCSNLPPSIVNCAKKISKPEKHHSSLYSKRKCQPPKKRYSYLYSQSEDSSNIQSYTSLKPNYSNEYDHGLPFGDLSLLESREKVAELLYDSNNLDQSAKTSRYVGSDQISKTHHNYLYSQSKDVPLCYVNSYSSLHSNFDTEYAQGLSSRSYPNLVSDKRTEELYEVNPIMQSTATIIYANEGQTPRNQDIYLYSQFKDDPSSSAKSCTVLPFNFNAEYSQGLSSGEFSHVESVKNTAGFCDSYVLDLSARRKKDVEHQLSENPHSSSHYQTEVLPSSTKPYRALDSYTENEHLLSSGNFSLVESAVNNSDLIVKDLTDAEREERRKEQSKRRSEKYRLNCQEKMKQLEEEHHNLQEKNKTLHAEFDKLKQQWDKLLTISPCFTGKCETFKPLNEIKKSLQDSRTVLKEVESDEDPIQTSKCKCKGQMKCESNKCSCYKSLISCTPRCHKNYSCRNH